jgi:hypothetical protein
MGWDREFSEPILLPKGKKLTTLRDAALYITKLPKAEHDAGARATNGRPRWKRYCRLRAAPSAVRFDPAFGRSFC